MENLGITYLLYYFAFKGTLKQILNRLREITEAKLGIVEPWQNKNETLTKLLGKCIWQRKGKIFKEKGGKGQIWANFGEGKKLAKSNWNTKRQKEQEKENDWVGRSRRRRNSWKITFIHCVAFASLESLGQDKTFKSLESLVRLYPKVWKVIFFFFWMHKYAWEDQNCYRFLKYDLLK